MAACPADCKPTQCVQVLQCINGLLQSCVRPATNRLNGWTASLGLVPWFANFMRSSYQCASCNNVVQGTSWQGLVT